MSTTTVTAFFDFPFDGPYWTLDDPVKGVLDGSTYGLYDATEVDLSSKVNSVTIRRGKSSQLFEDMNAGSGVVQFNNEDRELDPINSAGPYFGNILPGRKFVVATDGVTIFTGRVEDWDLGYDVSGRSTAVADLVDGLALLAGQDFDDWTATAAQTAGPRLSDVLDRDEVQWPYARSLDTGVSTFQGDDVAWGTNVLSYCNYVVKTDLGRFYCDREGVLTFKDRHATINAESPVLFDDTGTGVPFVGVGVSYGSELLYNRIGIQRAGGASQTVINLDSQLSYGIRSLSIVDLLFADDDQALEMANYLVGVYKDPQSRIELLRIELADLSAAQRLAVLTLDISSVVQVTWTPNGVGDPIDRLCVVEGIAHDIGVVLHAVTLHLSELEVRVAWQLEDPVFGALDAYPLSF